ncbi:MAG: Ig-like domain-containing protein [Longimicrobiales bacterium]
MIRSGRSASKSLAAGLVLAAIACSDATQPVVPSPKTLVPTADSIGFNALGDSRQMSATVIDQTGNVMTGVPLTWSTGNGLVATVSASGLVTAVANGSTSVTVAAGGASATIAVVIAQVATSIDVTPDSVVLDEPGDSAQVTVSVLDARGVAVTSPTLAWLSAHPSIATVDPAGRVSGVAAGMTLVSVTAGSAVAQVAVRVLPQLTLVAASPTTLSAQVTTGVSLSVQVRDLLGASYQGATVQWAADPGSGSITSQASTPSGVTGHAGAVWQLGTLAGAQRATARITSRGAVVEVAFVATALPGAATTAALTADSVLLSARGETVYLSPTYRDQFTNVTSPGGITWTSRNASVASVAPDGLVTGQGAGATYVIASMPSGTDSILVTVALRGAITLTFDDGFRTVYDNAWPIIQPMGLPANIAVNPAQVGFPAYMTKAHLDEVHAAGWSIVSHTMTHDTLTTHSVGELDWELRATKLWIDAQGYNGSNVFIVPFHLWGVRERDAIGSYYEAARGTSANAVVPDSLVAWRPANPYNLTGIDADQLPYTTQQGRDRLRDLLLRALNEGAFLDVFFHHVPTANLTAFQETMLVLDQFRERVIPYHRLYPRFARAVF